MNKEKLGFLRYFQNPLFNKAQNKIFLNNKYVLLMFNFNCIKIYY